MLCGRLVLHLIITLFTNNWPLTIYLVCRKFILSFFLYKLSSTSALLFSLFKFILLSQVHWRGSKLCVLENVSRKATNIFAVSVFSPVFPVVEPHGKPVFVWNLKWSGGGVGDSVKIYRPVDIRRNRTKLTIHLRENVRKILINVRYIQRYFKIWSKHLPCWNTKKTTPREKETVDMSLKCSLSYSNIVQNLEMLVKNTRIVSVITYEVYSKTIRIVVVVLCVECSSNQTCHVRTCLSNSWHNLHVAAFAQLAVVGRGINTCV
jgi:hypothetical protein